MKSKWIILLLMLDSCYGTEITVPPDDFIPGWKKAKKSHYFKGHDLFTYIDGGAELFLEFGFLDLMVQYYHYQGNEISLELYRMESPPAALGIYLCKCGRETSRLELPFRNTYNRFQLLAVKGEFFCLVNNFSGEEKFSGVMAKLLTLALVKVEEADCSQWLRSLPQEHLLAGSERLIRGPYGLQAIYTFGEGDILQLSGKVFAVLGEYQDQRENYTRLVVTYPDSQSLSQAWAHLQMNLDPYLTITKRNESVLVFKDYDDFWGKIRRKENRIDIMIHLSTEPEL